MKLTPWFFACALAAGCNGNAASHGGDGGAPQDLSLLGAPFDMALGAPPMGNAIPAAPDQWTWVDFPDSSCDDGSATGIGQRMFASDQGEYSLLDVRSIEFDASSDASSDAASESAGQTAE